MTTTARHPLVEDYLRRLWTEAGRLPVDQARELVAGIEEHIATALPPDSTESEVRNALERLGTPTELVAAAAAPDQPQEPAKKSFASPGGAIACLVFAEILCILLPVSVPLWIIGLVMMARVTVWSERDRMLGFVGLGTGLPLAFGAVFLSTAIVTSCSQVYENGQLVSDTCGGTNWVAVTSWSILLGYLALQAFAIWRLTRSARRR
jgi:uncharacterized membrane protein